MAMADGATAAETPTIDAATAAEAIIFLIMKLPFWFFSGCPPVPSALINSAAREWFRHITRKVRPRPEFARDRTDARVIGSGQRPTGRPPRRGAASRTAPVAWPATLATVP